MEDAITKLIIETKSKSFINFPFGNTQMPSDN